MSTRNFLRTVAGLQSSIRNVTLSSEQYPGLVRGRYGVISDTDIQAFNNILDTGRVLTDTDELEGYNVDWLRTVKGQSRCVLKPRSTEEVSEILSYCNKQRLAVVPQGGNTGLVGGSVPVFDEIILSSQLMNKIINIDEDTGATVCQAGVVLENLDTEVAKHGLMVPLDLGAKGSCHIGGNVSTNAGGLRLLRYGSLHGSVLGVEAVLANGEVIDCLTTLKKDNTGYDLKQLFIGSEGTLGFITKVAISCPTRPKSINLALLAVPSFEGVITVFKNAKCSLGEILSSCEFMDTAAMECVTGQLKSQSPTILHHFTIYVLLETSGSNSNHDEEKLNQFLENMLGTGTVTDGTVAVVPSKQRDIWQLRERVAESLLLDGYCYKYDISLPLSVFYNAVLDMRKRLGDKMIRCLGYGHVGDGNLHLNVTTKEYSKEVHDLIEPFLYEWTANYRGSISAEHGLGFKKRNYIGFSKSQPAIQLMKNIKQVMDPRCILNPYKVLPD
ncbi:D-2-hydroxyglutarate dehydrogenase, mitochondrial [Eurytemora carolleeae]|uniref:D-2-hydroxyglutarate dehydrogenase, mitochondrial n=1 Tax=Eurytemora carolleeae TaxID=1294199 RepID=UPI000C76CC40|nr:D-2-hydroxyglutarate dehydrogenase, mitochondrial [Eurytemora carolleeae]|eukprot:XP_023323293.1 D-2-hydroxyglutarate dehydrogenase, mitochondrial-like [Eurytemora affinis]